MVIGWRPAPPERCWGIRCHFEYENPAPACGVCGEEGCSDCARWTPWSSCADDPRVRVELDDGRYYNACTAEAHGYTHVVWWAPLYAHPRFEQTWNKLVKYVYREHTVEAALDRAHPLIRLLSERKA